MHFTTQNGLASDKVYGVHQDRTGFIWVYTANGIARYDGYNFKHYSLSNGLANNDIWDLWEDSKGRLWCSAYGRHISYIENSKAKKVYNPYANVLDLINFKEVDGLIYVSQVGTLSAGEAYWFKIINDTLHEVKNSNITNLKNWTQKRGMTSLVAWPTYFVCEKSDSLLFFDYRRVSK